MSRRLCCGFLSVLLAGSALAAPDPSTVKTLGTVYASYVLAEAIRDYCVQQLPGSADASRRAFSDWVQAQGLTDLATRLSRVLGPDSVSVLQNIRDRGRSDSGAALQKLGDASAVCAVYPAQLGKSPFDLKASVPDLATLLGAASPPAAAGTVVYSVAQLSTLVGTVVNGLPRNTPGDQLEAAVLKKLGALGRPLVVQGTVPTDHGWLTQEDQRHTARWNVYCFDFADEGASLDPYAGRSVTVVGTLREFDRDTFITLEGCRVLSGQTGLKPSSLPVSEVGWRPRPQDARQFLVPAGKGLKDSAVLGVYLRQSTGIGVGGMVIITYEPYLFLKDGSVYSEPYWAPDSFNVALSRSLEPQKWGRWTRAGQNFQIQWGSGERETLAPRYPARPAAPDSSLSGTFKSIGGGGNTALGGDAMVVVAGNYSFGPDGRFTGGRSASASTSNVTSQTSRATAGRYQLGGYGIRLRYDDGSEQRLLFYTVDRDMLHIGDSDYLR